MKNLWFVVLASLLAALPAGAQDEETDLFALEVHGFVSPGFLITSGNNHIAKSKRGSFEFTEAGINFTKPFSDDLRVGMQLFTRDLGPTGNYSVKLDWFYLDYRVADWLGFRGGRVKVPFGLYNEVSDVDAARAQVLLPQSVYPVQNRDYLLAQTGAEAYGRFSLGGAGALEYRLYGGTIFLETTTPAGTPYDIKSFDVPYLVGGRLMWETAVPGLRLGGSVQALRLDTDLLYDPAVWAALQKKGALPATFKGDVSVKIPALLWVGSVEYVVDDLSLASEYSRWHVEVDSTETTLFPEVDSVSERAYVMGAYHVTSWLQPGLYYSIYFPDVDNRTNHRGAYQHDTAATVRWDMTRNWLIKLEAHLMWGTATVSPQLNDDVARSKLTRTWGLFLAKTTGYF